MSCLPATSAKEISLNVCGKVLALVNIMAVRVLNTILGHLQDHPEWVHDDFVDPL
jgi:hypothetical protein